MHRQHWPRERFGFSGIDQLMGGVGVVACNCVRFLSETIRAFIMFSSTIFRKDSAILEFAEQSCPKCDGVGDSGSNAL